MNADGFKKVLQISVYNRVITLEPFLSEFFGNCHGNFPTFLWDYCQKQNNTNNTKPDPSEHPSGHAHKELQQLIVVLFSGERQVKISCWITI